MGTRLTLAATLLAATAACGGGIDVRSDYDPGIDFGSYSTFAILDEAEGGGVVDAFMDQRFKTGIANHLTSMGWSQVDNSAQADVAVGYQFTTDERVSYNTVHTGWGGYGYGYGGWYGPGWGASMSTSRTTENHYEVGSLIIAFFDTGSEEMVYISTGSKTLSDRNMTPEETQAAVDDAVRTILRDFPPGA